MAALLSAELPERERGEGDRLAADAHGPHQTVEANACPGVDQRQRVVDLLDLESLLFADLTAARDAHCPQGVPAGLAQCGTQRLLYLAIREHVTLVAIPNEFNLSHRPTLAQIPDSC